MRDLNTIAEYNIEISELEKCFQWKSLKNKIEQQDIMARDQKFKTIISEIDQLQILPKIVISMGVDPQGGTGKMVIGCQKVRN